MARITMRTRGHDNFRNRLRASEKDIDKIMSDRRAVDSITDKLQRRQETRWVKNFNSQGGEYGNKWAEIALSSLKTKKYPMNPTLVNTGSSKRQLRGFMTENAYPYGEIGIEWDFTGKGSSEFPLPFHHTGYTHWSGTTVPARVIWELDSKDEDSAYRRFSRWAHEEIRKIGIFS